MYKGGDKVRVVRADGVRWLRIGMLLDVAQDQPLNAAFIRVVGPGEVEYVIRADRVRMHVQHPNNAPVAPVVEAPVAPAKVPGVFAVGDRVLIARGEQPNHAHGMNQFMRREVGQGVVYTILDIVADHRFDAPSAHFEEVGNVWDIRMLDHEFQAPAIIPQAAPVPAVEIKQGPIAYEDVVPYMRAVFVGGGMAAHLGEFVLGQEVVVIGHYPGVREAWRVEHADLGEDGFACYRDNFHHAPLKEIVVGSRVRVIEPFGEMDMGRELVVTGIVNNAGGTLLQFGHNAKQWRKARFELVVGPAKAAPEPEPVVDEAELVVKRPFKEGDKVRIWVRETKYTAWTGQCAEILDNKTVLTIKAIDDYGRIKFEGRPIQVDTCCLIKPVPIPEGADLRKRFAVKEGGVHSGSLCSYAFVAGGVDTMVLNGPCHAYLRESKITEVVIGTVAMEAQSDMVPEMKRYHEWLANESPWAPSFITKDVEEAYREGGFILNTDQPKGHVVGAAIAARAAHEHESRLPTFIHFLEKGYSGSVAFLMSMVVCLEDKDSFSETSMRGGHDCLSSNLGYDETVSFFSKGFPDYKQVSCKEHGDGYNIHSMIDKREPSGNIPHGDKYGVKVSGMLVKKIVGEGWDKKTVVTPESAYELSDKFTKIIKEQA